MVAKRLTPGEKRIESLIAAKARRQRLRQRALNALGAQCATCGHEDQRVLEFDHIAHRGGRFDRKTLGVSQASLVRRVASGWPAGTIQLLCANCHRLKSLGFIDMKEETCEEYS